MKKKIYWYTQDFKNLPKDNDWLTQQEKQILENLKFLKRRNEWRLGRWTAKNAVQKYFESQKHLTFQDIHILTRENRSPYIKIDNHENNIALSISHRERKALSAVSDNFNAIGCDLELIETRSELFITDYFTPNEVNIVTSHPDQKDIIANLIWSAKESVSKVVQLGLNLSTHDVDVHTIQFENSSEWNDMDITLNNSNSFYGKWKQLGNYIITVAAPKLFDSPVSLH